MKGNLGPHILKAQRLLETPFLSKFLGPRTLRMKPRLLLSGSTLSRPPSLVVLCVCVSEFCVTQGCLEFLILLPQFLELETYVTRFILSLLCLLYTFSW